MGRLDCQRIALVVKNGMFRTRRNMPELLDESWF
jgi:hypothetical protein